MVDATWGTGETPRDVLGPVAGERGGGPGSGQAGGGSQARDGDAPCGPQQSRPALLHPGKGVEDRDGPREETKHKRRRRLTQEIMRPCHQQRNESEEPVIFSSAEIRA